MSLFPENITALSQQIIKDFAKHGLMVATAESCTGGLLSLIHI